MLSPTTFYEFRLSRYHSQSKQYVYEDPEAQVRWLVSVTADTSAGIEAEVFDPVTPEGEAKLPNIIDRGGSYEYIADPNGPDGYIHPDDINDSVDLLSMSSKTSQYIG